MSVHKTLPLQEFIQLIQTIPFVSSRYTLRLAEHFLSRDQDDLIKFCHTMMELRDQLEKCSICFCWKEKKHSCMWCSAERNQEILCIVETWIDMLSMERAGIFKGVYHVLGGVISPLDGVMPEMLTINPLLERLKNTPIKEIILSLNQTPEGEATAFYIERTLKQHNIVIPISYIASGVPVGSSLEFVDKLTLAKAMNNRRRQTDSY